VVINVKTKGTSGPVVDSDTTGQCGAGEAMGSSTLSELGLSPVVRPVCDSGEAERRRTNRRDDAMDCGGMREGEGKGILRLPTYCYNVGIRTGWDRPLWGLCSSFRANKRTSNDFVHILSLRGNRVKNRLHNNGYSTTIVQNYVGSLPPYILPDHGQRHVERQDHVVAQYLVNVFCPRPARF